MAGSRLYSPIAVATVLMTCTVGCNASLTETVTCKQMENALVDEEIKTIDDLYQRLAAGLVPGRTQDQLLNRDSAANFTSIERDLRNTYMQAPYEHRTLERAKELLAAEVTWKVNEQDINQITRVYSENTDYTSKLQNTLHWDVGIYFDVYTNDEGTILCWQRIE